MAPEVVQPNKKTGYDVKVDIWSVGCVMLEMWSGFRPWHGQETIAVMMKVRCCFIGYTSILTSIHRPVIQRQAPTAGPARGSFDEISPRYETKMLCNVRTSNVFAARANLT